MKRLFLLLTLLVPIIAIADPQGVQADATCHFPWDAANTDNEYKSSNTDITLNEDDDAGTYDMVCLHVQRYVLNAATWPEATPPGGDPVHIKGNAAAWLGDDGTYQTANTACSLTNDDGTTYTTNDWNLEIWWEPDESGSIFVKQYKLLNCRNGT